MFVRCECCVLSGRGLCETRTFVLSLFLRNPIILAVIAVITYKIMKMNK